LLVTLVVMALAGLVVALGREFARQAPAPAQPLSGQLTVVVRSGERGAEPQPVQEPGALPVRSGGNMNLEVQLSEPAYVYLVWLTTEGRVLPLYPWNAQALEIEDVAAPPPLRRPAKVLQSPLLGGGWWFGTRGGLETVLLLVRRTPLPPSVPLAPLLGAAPPAGTMQSTSEWILLERQGPSGRVTVKRSAGPDADAEAVPELESLRAWLDLLGKEFEFIQAVRFAHEGE
jgi:hypothetical protein